MVIPILVNTIERFIKGKKIGEIWNQGKNRNYLNPIIVKIG